MYYWKVFPSLQLSRRYFGILSTCNIFQAYCCIASLELLAWYLLEIPIETNIKETASRWIEQYYFFKDVFNLLLTEIFIFACQIFSRETTVQPYNLYALSITEKKINVSSCISPAEHNICEDLSSVFILC